jgi:hypothetical protein
MLKHNTAVSAPYSMIAECTQEVDAVVERLHSAARSKEGKVEAALSFKQYQELKACTFTPEITRSVPKQTVRMGLCTPGTIAAPPSAVGCAPRWHDC